MKTCPKCGKPYSDDTLICIIDGQTLDLPVTRRSVRGVWRGVYGYETGKNVSFTLKLQQGWFGHFTGTVTDDAPDGVPGTGTIDGYFGWPEIDFTKQMPTSYVRDSKGGLMTMREALIAKGKDCNGEIAGPSISYSGRFLNANQMQGRWMIKPRIIRLPKARSIATALEVAGIWCGEFVTSDLKAAPTDGPRQPFFQKELLSQPDKLITDGRPLKSLGKYRIVDAERILKRFEEENIKFEINRPEHQMSPFSYVAGDNFGNTQMIEIFVHGDDQEKAMGIVNEGSEV